MIKKCKCCGDYIDTNITDEALYMPQEDIFLCDIICLKKYMLRHDLIIYTNELEEE